MERESLMISLRGKALVLAKEAGLIRKVPFRGYDIGPFLKFWDSLSFYLVEIQKAGIDIREMLYEYGD